MLKKINIPKILVCLCLALILGTLISMRVPRQTEEPMQAFPSYDWRAGDAAALAALNYAQYNNTRNLSLIEYAERNYELYNELTEHDYELVTMLESQTQGKVR